MDEARAVRIALEGSGLARLRLAVGALARLLYNPDDTVEVFFLGIALNGPQLPALMGRIAGEAKGLALLCERPTIDSSTVDWQRLRALPVSTLGGAYARYLDDNKLDPDLFQPPPALPLGTLFKSPRSARLVWDGYVRGKAAAFLPVVRFEDLWERDLEELRRELHIKPRRPHGRSAGPSLQ